MRRGYNVTAKPYPGKEDKLAQGGWQKVFKAARANAVKNISDIHNKMKSYGDGARAIVKVVWKAGGGHVFIAENVSGHIRLIDPQTHNSDVTHYLSGRYTKETGMRLQRIDNAVPTKYLNKIAIKK